MEMDSPGVDGSRCKGTLPNCGVFERSPAACGSPTQVSIKSQYAGNTPTRKAHFFQNLFHIGGLIQLGVTKTIFHSSTGFNFEPEFNTRSLLVHSIWRFAVGRANNDAFRLFLQVCRLDKSALAYWLGNSNRYSLLLLYISSPVLQFERNTKN